MKRNRKLLGWLLALVMALGSFPTGALALSDRVVDVGDTITLHATSGTGHVWSCSDSSVLRITNRSGPYCTLEGVKPGTVVVTVTYNEMRQDLVYNPVTGSYTPGSASYQTYEAWDVIVRSAGSHNGAETTEKNGSVGENVAGKIDDIRWFGVNGLVPVKSGGLWGYADANLDLVIPFQYDGAGSFNASGMAVVTVNGNNYVIDSKGNYVIHTSYELYNLDGNGAISAKQYGGGWVYLTTSGKTTSADAYMKAHQAYEEGRAARGDMLYEWTADGKWQYAVPGTDENDWVLAIQPPEGVSNKDNKYPYMYEGLVNVKKDGLYGALDRNGRFVIQPVYDYLGRSGGGWVSYKKDGEFGVLENPVRPPEKRPSPSVKPSEPTPTPTPVPTPTPAPAPSPTNAPSFTDVKSSDYFAVPVAWAVDRKITSGTGNGRFSPDRTCSTKEILTFIWLASGSPEPKEGNPFSDVKETDFFYKSALWAYENGLVSGTRLNGDSDCTRGATVEYLWKLAGSPAVGSSPFTDAGRYAQAAAWASEQGVASGTGNGEFSPEMTCTRGQIVTLLYKNFADRH